MAFDVEAKIAESAKRQLEFSVRGMTERQSAMNKKVNEAVNGGSIEFLPAPKQLSFWDKLVRKAFWLSKPRKCRNCGDGWNYEKVGAYVICRGEVLHELYRCKKCGALRLGTYRGAE